MRRKKLNPRKITGQLGINLIERVVLQMGYAWHPSNSELDVGIDGIIEICDPETHEATNNIIQVQSKTQSHYSNETDDSFEYVCDKRDIEYWLAGNAPVILIVSRADDSGESYWISIKEYFDDLPKKESRRVLFNKHSDKFDRNCAGLLRDLAVPGNSGIYIAPLPRTERLIPNLLRVTYYPKRLYLASTHVRRNGEIWSWAKENRRPIGGEWILKSKQILSFHNLQDHPWTEFCDVGSVETFDVNEWALSEERDRQNEFIQLLSRCLKECLVRQNITYNKFLDLYYFRATYNLTERILKYRSLRQSAHRVVFRGYPSKKVHGRIAYYRHSAFSGEFLCLDGEWYLQVNPTYYFTSDGWHLSRYSADRMSGIKRLEQNSAVLGQLLMWFECLSGEGTLFDEEYSFLKFNRLRKFDFAHGVDDNLWIRKEDDAPRIEKSRQISNQVGLFEL